MVCVKAAPGVSFTRVTFDGKVESIAPGGFRLLAALWAVSVIRQESLTITSACDGEHSGPDDPHHRGEAYDVRSHDLTDKHATLACLVANLDRRYFYAFLEDEGTPNEHIHCQVRKGVAYPC